MEAIRISRADLGFPINDIRAFLHFCSSPIVEANEVAFYCDGNGDPFCITSQTDNEALFTSSLIMASIDEE